jgi:hypothetical protein
MTNEEIQIMGLTLQTKVKKAKSMRLDSDKISSARSKEDLRDSDAKKSSRKKTGNDPETDTPKDSKKDSEHSGKNDTDGALNLLSECCCELVGCLVGFGHYD